MTKQEELAKEYRNYREECGINDPIMLDEIEEAYFQGISKQADVQSDDLDVAIGDYCSNSDNFITFIDTGFAYRSEEKDDIPLIIKAIKFGAQWQQNQIAKENMLLPFKEYDNLMDSINKKKKEGYDAGFKQGMLDFNREHTSNTLEKEIVHWLDEGLPNEEEVVDHIKETARHFTNWQKQKDTLPVSDDLEEVAQKWAYSEYHQDNGSDCDCLYSGFKKGAQWQEQQMMKNSITTIIQEDDCGDLVPTLSNLKDFNEGDKVKVLIIK